MNPIKKNIFFLSPSLWPIFELEISYIQEYIDKKEKIYLISCEKTQNYCSANNLKIRNFGKTNSICNWCQSRYDSGLNWLKSKNLIFEKKSFDNLNDKQSIQIKKLENYLNKRKKFDISVSKFFKPHDINYKQLLQSSIDCEERANSVKLNQYYYSKIKKITINILKSYFSALNHIQQIKPNKIFIFNGRDNTYHPILLAAKKLINKKNLYVYEFPDVSYQAIKLTNKNYPHDISNHSKEMFLDYKNKKLINKSKIIQRGKAIIDKRMNQQDFNTFVAWKPNQKTGLLPDLFTQNKFNLSIFTSSEYEIRNIPENEKKINYGSQFDLIKEIILNLKKIKSDVNLFVRTHPSQINEFKKFRTLENEKNFVKVIGPKSNISSYTLGKESNLSLVFHSTIGLELSSLKSKVIIIGPTMYQDFKVAEILFDKKKILKRINELIKNRKIKPKVNPNKAFEAMYAFESYLKTLKFVKKDSFRISKLLNNNKKYVKLKDNFFYKSVTYLIYFLRKILKLLQIKL